MMPKKKHINVSVAAEILSIAKLLLFIGFTMIQIKKLKKRICCATFVEEDFQTSIEY